MADLLVGKVRNNTMTPRIRQSNKVVSWIASYATADHDAAHLVFVSRTSRQIDEMPAEFLLLLDSCKVESKTIQNDTFRILME